MTTIKATCPTCGEVSLTPDDIQLWIDRGERNSFYAFTCPACRSLVRKAADERVIRLLAGGGVEVRDIVPPPHDAHRFSGPPFTYDDLLDFHALLDRDDWFDDLLALAHPPLGRARPPVVADSD
jgi:hypothetical protein